MKNGLEVFDFKEEDETAELACKWVGKLKNPSLDNSAIWKYQFLECVSQERDVPKKETGSLICLNVDAVECANATTHVQSGTVREGLVTEEGNSGSDAAPQFTSSSREQDPCFQEDDYECKRVFSECVARISCHKEPLPGKSQLNHSATSSGEAVNEKPDGDECMEECSPSSPTCEIEEADVISNEPTSANCSSNSETRDISAVVDYVVYRGKYCTGCLVTFSCNGIKINGTTAHGVERTFGFERNIDDIIRIDSQYLQRFETVMIKLCVLSKDAVLVDNAQDTSGIEELEFAIVEPNWSGKWEEIASLNVKYSALWSDVHDMDMEMDGGVDLLQQSRYFPNFETDFEDVIYPKGDSDAVSISKRDVDLLQPETFINDTIIDFYSKYLKNQIHPEEKHRFHFFNSFFFRKLADLDKDPSSAKDGRAAFLRVHKWTRKVDIFGKDYIFIPVNFNLHWSLLVICHPGEVAGAHDEDKEKSVRVPCILHMDSIRGTHAGLKNLVQSYLWEEWKERQKDTSDDMSSKFLNLRFVPLELPQQENSFDCGLFLLHYLELFLVEAPVNFSPFRINELNKFLNADWFPPAEASLKRTLIQRLISELLQIRSQEVSSSNCSDEPKYNFPESNVKESGLERVSERCTPAATCPVNLSSSEPGEGIEITLLETSSARNSHSVNDPGLVLREFFEPGVGAGPLLARYPSFGQQQSSYYQLNGAISQIEDDTETGQQFVYFHSGDPLFQEIAGLTPQDGSTACSFRGIGANNSWNPGISLQAEDNDSSSEASICASDDSDIGIIENPPVKEDASLLQQENFNQRSSSLGNIECSTESLASASREMFGNDRIQDGNENGGLASRHGNFSASLLNDPNLVENGAEAPQPQVNMQKIQGSQNLEAAKGADRIYYGNVTPCEENFSSSLQEDSAMVENGSLLDSEKAVGNENGVQTICDDDVVSVGSDEQQAAKRPRLTSHEIGGRLTGNLSKDLQL